jgi:hypothetical protein
MALDALPAELRARVMAATAQASYRRAFRRRRGGASGINTMSMPCRVTVSSA